MLGLGAMGIAAYLASAQRSSLRITAAFSRQISANSYAMDSKQLGVYSLELIIQRGFRPLFR